MAVRALQKTEPYRPRSYGPHLLDTTYCLLKYFPAYAKALLLCWSQVAGRIRSKRPYGYINTGMVTERVSVLEGNLRAL